MNYKIPDASFCWLSNKYIYIIISLTPIDHLKLKKYIRRQEYICIIDNMECLCPHGHLNPLKPRMGKYIYTSFYNKLKLILEKYLDRNKSYALNEIEEDPTTFTNNDIMDK